VNSQRKNDVPVNVQFVDDLATRWFVLSRGLRLGNGNRAPEINELRRNDDI
jgi:hypothetical protein